MRIRTTACLDLYPTVLPGKRRVRVRSSLTHKGQNQSARHARWQGGSPRLRGGARAQEASGVSVPALWHNTENPPVKERDQVPTLQGPTFSGESDDERAAEPREVLTKKAQWAARARTRTRTCAGPELPRRRVGQRPGAAPVTACGCGDVTSQQSSRWLGPAVRLHGPHGGDTCAATREALGRQDACPTRGGRAPGPAGSCPGGFRGPRWAQLSAGGWGGFAVPGLGPSSALGTTRV